MDVSREFGNKLNINPIAKLSQKNIGIQLNKLGYFLIEGTYNKNFCDHIKNAIDDYKISHDTELNYENTEIRIWDAHTNNNFIKSFFEDAENFVKNYLKIRINKNKKFLAIKNSSIAHLSNQKSLSLGRWHIDSLKKQIKVFLFVSDVFEDSGAFEVIPKSHKLLFKLKMLFQKQYLKFEDFYSKNSTRKYQKVCDKFIKNKVLPKFPSKKILCPAGTVMIVDTSALHRASPCLNGSRYVLTAYI